VAASYGNPVRWYLGLHTARHCRSRILAPEAGDRTTGARSHFGFGRCRDLRSILRSLPRLRLPARSPITTLGAGSLRLLWNLVTPFEVSGRGYREMNRAHFLQAWRMPWMVRSPAKQHQRFCCYCATGQWWMSECHGASFAAITSGRGSGQEWQ